MKKRVFGTIALVISTIGLGAQIIAFESIQEQLIDLGEVRGNNEEYYNCFNNYRM